MANLSKTSNSDDTIKYKNIRFDYFRIDKIDYDNDDNTATEKPFDLSTILIEASKHDVPDRTYTNKYDEPVKLQIVGKENIDGLYDIWKMQFVRVREAVVPGIATTSGKYHPMHLGDDEGIGEDITVIYDPEICVIAVQRNRNSIQPVGIADFFNHFIAKGYDSVAIRPIIYPEDYLKYTPQSVFKKLTVKLSDINGFSSDSRALFEIINSVKEMQALNVEITFSFGRHGKKNSTLNRDETNSIIKQLQHDPRTSKLLLSSKENQDTKVELHDLIEDRVHDNAVFAYSRKMLIMHETIYPKLKELFVKRRPKLRKLLLKNE